MSQEEQTPVRRLHGWWSDKQEEHLRSQYGKGSIRYTTPDGGEVSVTNVTDSPDDHCSGWDDMEYVGEVVSPVELLFTPKFEGLRFAMQLP